MENGWPRVCVLVSNLRVGTARSRIWREDHSQEIRAAGAAACGIYRLGRLSGWVELKQEHKHNYRKPSGNLSAHHHLDLRLIQPDIANRGGGGLPGSSDDAACNNGSAF